MLQYVVFKLNVTKLYIIVLIQVCTKCDRLDWYKTKERMGLHFSIRIYMGKYSQI